MNENRLRKRMIGMLKARLPEAKPREVEEVRNSRRKRWSLALLLTAAVTGATACAANMVETRGASVYGPTNERRGGRVKYLADGASFVVQSRREDAYQQMYRFCGGQYQIVREWNELGGQVTTGWANSQTTGSATGTNTGYGWGAAGQTNTHALATSMTFASTYRNIEFECSPLKKAPQLPRGAMPTRSTLQPSAGPAMSSGEVFQVVRERLSVETGCASETITVERTARLSETSTAYRLRACGKPYVCTEDPGGIECRPALADDNAPAQSETIPP